MNPIALAVLLTIVPSDPPAVDNAMPVAVTAVRVAVAGGERTIARIPAGHRVRVRGAERIFGFEMDACPPEARDAYSDPVERGACWRALTRPSRALATATETATPDLMAVLLRPAPEPADQTVAASRA